MWLTPRVLFSKTKADMHLFSDAECLFPHANDIYAA